MFGVFDGHGQNGHFVSNIVKNRLPSLLLGQITGETKSFELWKQAFETSFKAMDKEIKVEENLDCSYSGSTAVVVVKQVIIIKNRFGLMMEFSSMRIEINGCY